MRLLLDHGADVNVRDKYGKTTSDLASLYGYPEIVELLFEYSVIFLSPDAQGLSRVPPLGLTHQIVTQDTPQNGTWVPS